MFGLNSLESQSVQESIKNNGASDHLDIQKPLSFLFAPTNRQSGQGHSADIKDENTGRGESRETLQVLSNSGVSFCSTPHLQEPPKSAAIPPQETALSAG